MGIFNFFSRKPKEDVKLFYHTDVHCHILPGVDHGSQDVQQSLEMLQAEIDMGISRVMCTSHVTAITFENTVESLTNAGKVLQAAINEHHLPVEIHPSAEYRLDDYWSKEYAAGHMLPMPGNYLLIECPFVQELLEIDNIIFELQVKGFKPILAHPERYSYWYSRHDRYEKLHNQGVKFQSNILSLAGYYGDGAREAALWLVNNNMVEMLGSDMHNMRHAEIIKNYINGKEWAKLSRKLEPRNQNDLVK